MNYFFFVRLLFYGRLLHQAISASGHWVTPAQQAVRKIPDNVTILLGNKDFSLTQTSLAVRREPVLPRSSYNFFACWIVVSGWFVITGWILSFCGALNLLGYSISTLALVATLIFGFRPVLPKFDPWRSVRRLNRRFRHPLPGDFPCDGVSCFYGWSSVPAKQLRLSYLSLPATAALACGRAVALDCYK